jgi:hypothetical protein
MKAYKYILLFILPGLFLIVPAYSQNSALSNRVNAVIGNYLALKNALASGDGNLASAKGKLLLASVNEVPQAGLKPDQAALLSKLAYDSRHISEVAHVPHQREHFASLSGNLYTLIKKLKLNQATLYRQYCTMTRQYFLSESAGGRDPYMGMNNCSKVAETLPAAGNSNNVNNTN